jgi:predicted dehydrogenase
MILVVGGGFGLYGHVAALAGAGREVATLAAYRERAKARPELAHLLPRISWVDDVMVAAREVEALVLARTPGQNAELVRALMAQNSGATLVIEKPVAETPIAATALEAKLAAADRRWAVPYLFAECDWADTARVALAAGKSVEIDWGHHQSPMVRGWKREADAGGGAIAFYFIHFIALAETLMPGCNPVFDMALDSAGVVTGCSMNLPRHCEQSEAIQGGARNTGLVGLRPPTAHSARNDENVALQLSFSLGQEAKFRVRIDGQSTLDTATPFGPIPTAGSPDPRIPMLATFHQRVATDPQFQPPAFHSAITRHWAALEAIARA